MYPFSRVAKQGKQDIAKTTKKIEGRKRHIIVDKLGLINIADVHSASIQDRDGALDLFVQAKRKHQLYKGFLLTRDTQAIYKINVLSTGYLLTIAKKSHRVSDYSKALDSRKNFCMAFKF